MKASRKVILHKPWSVGKLVPIIVTATCTILTLSTAVLQGQQRQTEKPVSAASASEIRKRINDLVHEDFSVRVDAKRVLANAGESAVPALATALEDTKLKQPVIEVLELIGARAAPALATAMDGASADAQTLMAILMIRADPGLKADVTTKAFRKLIKEEGKLERGEFQDLNAAFHKVGKDSSRQLIPILIETVETDLSRGASAAKVLGRLGITNAIPSILKLKANYVKKHGKYKYAGSDGWDVDASLSRLRTLTGEAFEPFFICVTNSWECHFFRLQAAPKGRTYIVLGFLPDSTPTGCPHDVRDIEQANQSKFIRVLDQHGNDAGRIVNADRSSDDQERPCNFLILETEDNVSRLHLQFASGRKIGLSAGNRGSFTPLSP